LPGFFPPLLSPIRRAKCTFSVTREGKPLAHAAVMSQRSVLPRFQMPPSPGATGDEASGQEAPKAFETYLRYSFTPGECRQIRVDPSHSCPRQPTRGIGLALVTARNWRAQTPGDSPVSGRVHAPRGLTSALTRLSATSLKPTSQALMPGSRARRKWRDLDHFDRGGCSDRPGMHRKPAAVASSCMKGNWRPGIRTSCAWACRFSTGCGSAAGTRNSAGSSIFVIWTGIAGFRSIGTT